MKHFVTFLLFNLFCITAFSQNNNSKNLYTVPDSIKAIGFYAEIKITDSSKLKKEFPGIGINKSGLDFGYNSNEKVIKFLIFAVAVEKATGLNVYKHTTGHAWNFDWKYGETYPLLISYSPGKKMEADCYPEI